jgi:hypothetical protein
METEFYLEPWARPGLPRSVEDCRLGLQPTSQSPKNSGETRTGMTVNGMHRGNQFGSRAKSSRKEFSRSLRTQSLRFLQELASRVGMQAGMRGCRQQRLEPARKAFSNLTTQADSDNSICFAGRRSGVHFQRNGPKASWVGLPYHSRCAHDDLCPVQECPGKSGTLRRARSRRICMDSLRQSWV